MGNHTPKGGHWGTRIMGNHTPKEGALGNQNHTPKGAIGEPGSWGTTHRGGGALGKDHSDHQMMNSSSPQPCTVYIALNGVQEYDVWEVGRWVSVT